MSISMRRTKQNTLSTAEHWALRHLDRKTRSQGKHCLWELAFILFSQMSINCCTADSQDIFPPISMRVSGGKSEKTSKDGACGSDITSTGRVCETALRSHKENPQMQIHRNICLYVFRHAQSQILSVFIWLVRVYDVHQEQRLECQAGLH